jgi:ABC-2 type transport system ATP-binding protein
VRLAEATAISSDRAVSHRPARSGVPGYGIKTVGLSKTYGIRGLLPGRPRVRINALVDVNLEVAAQAIHGVIGPNGSGKTTLLRILATLVLPTSGQAFIGDVEVTESPNQIKRCIGFSTGDERSLYWRLTGRQNLLFFADLFNVAQPRERVGDVLASFGLEAAADRPLSSYSQGMARRLALARSMLHEPPVLLLDEPSKSLDPISRANFHEVLRNLRQTGHTVVLATHDMAEAAEVCDHVTVIAGGQVVRTMDGANSASLLDAIREQQS